MELYVEVMDYVTNVSLSFNRTVVNGELVQYGGWIFGQPVGPVYTLSYTNPTTGITTDISGLPGVSNVSAPPKGFGEPIGVIPASETVANSEQSGTDYSVENDTVEYNAYVLQGTIVGTTTTSLNSPPSDGPVVNMLGNAYTLTETFTDGQPTQTTVTGATYLDPYLQYFWVDVGPSQSGKAFVFHPYAAPRTIHNFVAKGPDHDNISLPSSDFLNIAQVLRDTTMSGGSATIKDPNTRASIKLENVTKSELKAHRSDFSFY